MDVRLLGPVEVLIDGTPRPLGGPRQRAVLADLALHAGRAVPIGQLIDDVWGESLPESAVHTVAAYVSRLRRALQVPGEPSALLTAGSGYSLDIDAGQVDVLRFRDLASQAREAFGHGDLTTADALLGTALAGWRGVPLADLGGAPFAVQAAQRLADDRCAVLELLFDVRLALGRHQDLVPAVEAAIAEDPFRERFHAQLMTALYRSGRQADALAAYRNARHLLVRAHGLEPGRELRELEQAILVQAPTLEAPTLEAPTLEAPTLEAPTLEAPTLEAPTLEAPTLEAPTLEAPTLEAPTLEAPTLEAPVRPRDGGVLAEPGPAAELATYGPGAAPADPAGRGDPGTAGRGDPGTARPGRRTRHRIVRWAALAAVPVLIAAVGTPRLPGLPPAHAHAAAPLGVSELTPAGTVAAGVRLPGQPGGAAAGARSVWVTSPEAHALYRVDPVGRVRQATIGVGAGAGAVAVGGSQVWVANALAGTVSRVDAGTDRVVQTVAVGSEPTGLAVADGRVWVADESASALSVLDATTGRVVTTEPLSAPPFGIAVGAGSVWITSPGDDSVTRLEPGGGPGVAISVGSGPTAVAFGLGSVWVANSLDSTVTRIDPATDSVAATIGVGDGPDALAVVGSTVWVGNRLSSTLTRIDAATDVAGTPLALDASPVAFAAIDGGVWAATRTPLSGQRRGGTLRVVSAAAPPSIDPALSDPELPPQFAEGTYDTLVTFQRVGGSEGLQVVPDLALALPTVTADGTEYSFVLRSGLRYSTGRPVRPEDFRYAVERVLALNPAAGSFLGAIAGASSCQGGKLCDLSRGITVSDLADSVTFHLAAPDPDFLDILAFPVTAPVPATVSPGDVGDHPVPSTGPYRIGRYLPGREIDFVRNPYFREWSVAAEPAGSPDRITWTFGASIATEVADIESGRADWTNDSVPDVGRLVARFPSGVHISPSLGIDYAAFNTTAAPFDDARVRRAFSLAADRSALVAALGGPGAATPTCQILPPGIPGYRPYCPFTADPGPNGQWRGTDLPAARKLVAESGTAGMRVTVWSHQYDETVGTFIVSVLRELGYQVSMVSPDESVFAANVDDSRKHVQVTDGSWDMTIPSPSALFDLFFRCSASSPADPAATRNGSFYCDPAVDHLMDVAESEQQTDPAGAAATWTAVDRDVTDDAPWVPLVVPTSVDFVSERVQNYQANPIFGVLLDQLTLR